MRRLLGSTLLYFGAAIGIAACLALLGVFHLSGVAWLAGIAITKLTFLSSGALMATGGLALRAQNRADAKRLSAGQDLSREMK